MWGIKASDVAGTIRAIYGEDVIGGSTARKWILSHAERHLVGLLSIASSWSSNSRKKTRETSTSDLAAWQCQPSFYEHHKGGHLGARLEVIPHPPCSPDLDLTDFHVFRSLPNDRRRMFFNDDVTSKPPDFPGIEKLPDFSVHNVVALTFKFYVLNIVIIVRLFGILQACAEKGANSTALLHKYVLSYKHKSAWQNK